MTETAHASHVPGAQPLLHVEHLTKEFPVEGGVFLEKRNASMQWMTSALTSIPERHLDLLESPAAANLQQAVASCV